jgi:hypothetical protein
VDTGPKLGRSLKMAKTKRQGWFGCFLVVLVVGAVQGVLRAQEGQYPASRLGVRTAPLLLLSRPDVRAEVGLTAEQATSAARTLDELHARAEALRGKTGPDVLAARRAIDETQQHWLETQLKPEQRTRLIQIDLQWEGPAALVMRPGVADTLGLSVEQRSRLAKAVADHKKRSPEAQQADARALAQQALTMLTPEQRDQWKNLLGRPFVPQQASAKAPSGDAATR